MSKTTNDEKNKPDDQEPGKVIDPHFYALDFQLTSSLKIADPTDYVTRIYGRILLEEHPADEQGGDDGDDSNHRFAALALRMDLTLYDLDRAQEEGQNPRDIFDCVSQGALEMYQQIYDGFELRPAIEAVIGEDFFNSSLLVIEAIEVTPQFRGRGLGLAAALKAMQVFGPAGGLVALVAAPLQQSFGHDVHPALWWQQMKMDDFPPDSPQVRQKLSAYWSRLGFQHVGDQLHLLSLAKKTPCMSDVLRDLEKMR